MASATISKTASVVDETFIRRALQFADMNALRIALYHQTGDEELAEMSPVSIPVRGGAFELLVVGKVHHEAIREKALAFLLDKERNVVAPPAREEAVRLMEMFQGRSLREEEVAFGYEDLAFEDFPRCSDWSGNPPEELLKDFDVTIIGSGFSGIATAIQLNRLGIRYRILDRYEDTGGTWLLNDYPEARVDVASYLYQFKFEKNYPWSEFFSTQAELKRYTDFILDKYDIRKNISLKTELKKAQWDEGKRKWHLDIQNADGEMESIETDVVISCVGIFGNPALPDIPGLDDFHGEMFHTTNWNHNFETKGKRIAVIGTGSTGAQLVPGLAKDAGQLTVYQRTPNWITPVKGYHEKVPAEVHWLMDALPGYWNWFVYQQHVSEIQVQNFQILDPDWQASNGGFSEKSNQLSASLKDYIRLKVGHIDGLYEKLVPDYAPTARRLVIDNGFYDALVQDNVELNVSGIEKVTENGILSKDGTHSEYDLIVLSSGFEVNKYLWPVDYIGRDGLRLEDFWSKDGPRAHLGVSVPHFPNLFILYGPNAQARGGGFHSWVEALSRYACDLIVQMLEKGAQSIEIKQEAFDDYNAELDEAMKATIWVAEGKGGYYVNKQGRPGITNPLTMYEFYNRLNAERGTVNFDFG